MQKPGLPPWKKTAVDQETNGESWGIECPDWKSPDLIRNGLVGVEFYEEVRIVGLEWCDSPTFGPPSLLLPEE